MSGACGCEELPGAFPRCVVFEHSASGDEDLSTCPYHARHRVLVDSAVAFNAKVQPARLPEPRKHLDFVQRRGDERLAAKSRIHLLMTRT